MTKPSQEYFNEQAQLIVFLMEKTDYLYDSLSNLHSVNDSENPSTFINFLVKLVSGLVDRGLEMKIENIKEFCVLFGNGVEGYLTNLAKMRLDDTEVH